MVCDLRDAPIRPGSIDVILALGSLNFGTRDVIEYQLRWVAGWLTPNGRIIMRANPGMATGPGLEFFAWSAENVDPIGAAAGLHRDGPIRYDTYRKPARRRRTPPGMAVPTSRWPARSVATGRLPVTVEQPSGPAGEESMAHGAVRSARPGRNAPAVDPTAAQVHHLVGTEHRPGDLRRDVLHVHLCDRPGGARGHHRATRRRPGPANPDNQWAHPQPPPVTGPGCLECPGCTSIGLVKGHVGILAFAAQGVVEFLGLLGGDVVTDFPHGLDRGWLI